MVYDAAPSDDYVVLFGGLEPNGTVSGQTWIYGGGCWENLFPTGSSKPLPPARWDATMAFDALDGYVVLYGGCSAPAQDGLCTVAEPRNTGHAPYWFSSALGDTWKYGDGGWALLLSAIGPSPPAGETGPTPRYDAAMAWDGATQSIVMFGGACYELAAAGTDYPAGYPCDSGSLMPSPTNVAMAVLSDTWSYTRATGWTQLDESGASPPSGYGGRMAYDPWDEMEVMFGGTSLARTSSCPSLADPSSCGADSGATWEFQGGAWSAYADVSETANPAARFDATMVDRGNGDILLEGGANENGTVFNDVWQFHSAATGWQPLQNGSPTDQAVSGAPIPRYDAAAAWDLWDGYFLMFGGSSPSGFVLDDGWSFALPAGWATATRVTTLPSTAPSSRYLAAMVYDTALGAVVLFGGEACGASACTFLGDTWLYDAGSWQALPTDNAPSARFGASIDYNPSSGAVLLFGGCGAVCPLGDTWQFARPRPTSPPAWLELFPVTAPPARYYAAMTFDAYDNVTVLFGGCEGAKGPCPSGDTWVYTTNHSAPVWKFLPTPLGAAAPPARFGAAMSALSTVGEVPVSGSFNGTLLFGGEGQLGMLADTWNFSYWPSHSGRQPRWTDISPYPAPYGRVFGSLVYDPADASLILFGGCEKVQCPALDAWNFSLLAKPVPPPSGGGGGVTPPGPGPPPPPPPPPPPWPWAPINITTTILWSASSAPPAPIRYGTGAVWDPNDGADGYALFVGGRTSNGATLRETDMLTGFCWTKLANLD
jgi:hypothetical protein